MKTINDYLNLAKTKDVSEWDWSDLQVNNWTKKPQTMINHIKWMLPKIAACKFDDGLYFVFNNVPAKGADKQYSHFSVYEMETGKKLFTVVPSNPNVKNQAEVWVNDELKLSGSWSEAVKYLRCGNKTPEVAPITKPVAKLIGEDGNVFNLLGICSRTLKAAGQGDLAKNLLYRVTHDTRSYDEALAVMAEYVEIA
jgi:hypothetical protein